MNFREAVGDIGSRRQGTEQGRGNLNGDFGRAHFPLTCLHSQSASPAMVKIGFELTKCPLKNKHMACKQEHERDCYRAEEV